MAHRKVLLIDYEPKSIESTSRPLRDAGFLVEVAQDGLAGLEAFHRIKPDIVLVEAMLPKKHGFDVCQEIKGCDDGKNTPVLITTGVYRGRKYRDQALANFGCDEYLEKPIDAAELVRVCRGFLADAGVSEPDSPVSTPLDLADLEALSEDEISDRLDNLLADFGNAVDDVAGDAPEPEASLEDDVAETEPVPGPDAAELDSLVDGAAVPPERPEVKLELDEIPVPDVVEVPVETSIEAPIVLPEDAPDKTFDIDAEIIVGPAAQVDDEVAIEAAVAAPVPVAVDTPAGSKRGWLIAAAAIVVAAAAGAGWYFTQGGDTAHDPAPTAQVSRPVPAPAVRQPIPVPVNDGAADIAAAAVETPVVYDAATAAPEPVVQEFAPQKTEPAPRTKPPAAKVEDPPVRTAPPPRDEPVATNEAPAVIASTPTKTEPVVPEPEPEPIKVEDAATTAAALGAAAVGGSSAIEPAATEVAPAMLAPDVGVRNEPPVVSRPTPPPPEPVVRVKVGALVPLIEVDREPVPNRKVQPKYHAIARQLRQEGSVVVRILVDETGKVLETELVRGIPNSSLNDSAAQALRKWTYEPAMKDGVPVKVWTTETVRFRL